MYEGNIFYKENEAKKAEKEAPIVKIDMKDVIKEKKDVPKVAIDFFIHDIKAKKEVPNR